MKYIMLSLTFFGIVAVNWNSGKVGVNWNSGKVGAIGTSTVAVNWNSDRA